jgi:hypothetical protein
MTSRLRPRRAALFFATMFLLAGGAGCELIASIDRTKIDAGSLDEVLDATSDVAVPASDASDATVDADAAEGSADTGASDAGGDVADTSVADAPQDAFDATDGATDDAADAADE